MHWLVDVFWQEKNNCGLLVFYQIIQLPFKSQLAPDLTDPNAPNGPSDSTGLSGLGDPSGLNSTSYLTCPGDLTNLNGTTDPNGPCDPTGLSCPIDRRNQTGHPNNFLTQAMLFFGRLVSQIFCSLVITVCNFW